MIDEEHWLDLRLPEKLADRIARLGGLSDETEESYTNGFEINVKRPVFFSDRLIG